MYQWHQSFNRKYRITVNCCDPQYHLMFLDRCLKISGMYMIFNKDLFLNKTVLYLNGIFLQSIYYNKYFTY